MGNLVEEKEKRMNEPKETNEYANLNMDQMRSNFGVMPIKSCANRLRATIQAYSQEE